jgi:hypothetical protein
LMAVAIVENPMAAGSGVARSNTEELPPLGTVAQDPATLYAGVVSTSGIRSGLSSLAALALWLRGSQAPIADRTSRRERFRHAPAVYGTDGACHLEGVWEHRSSPLIADRFSDRMAPADTIPPCANSPLSIQLTRIRSARARLIGVLVAPYPPSTPACPGRLAAN